MKNENEMDVLDLNVEGEFEDLRKYLDVEPKEAAPSLSPEEIEAMLREAEGEDGPSDAAKARQARKEAAKKPAEKQSTLMGEILGWVVPMAVAVALAFFIKNYIIINAHVPSGSMENTIMTGDNLIGYRLSYRTKDPQRGDIVIFLNPDNEKQKYIKRIIGLPGETVVIDDAKVYIDGVELEEDYLKEKWIIATGYYEFEIPENCYLMLGDNRNNSEDARYWENTYVSRDKIIGKAICVYWPISDWTSLTD